MIDVLKLKDLAWAKYSNDEEYLIEFVTDEQSRAMFADQDLEKMTNDEAAKRTIEVAIRVTHDWKGIKAHGEPWPCTEENKKELFSKLTARAAFIFRQSKNESLFMGEIDSKN